LVLTACSDKFARLWSVDTQVELRRFSHGNDRVYRAVFSADERRIATASEDGTAAAWDAMTGDRLAVPCHDYPVNAVLFSTDGSRIVTCSYDRTAKLWDGQSYEEVARLDHDEEVKHIAFSPDGSLILTTAADHTARLWSSKSGEELNRFRHTETVAFGSFAADGQHLITASLDGTARVWNRHANAEISRVPWSILSLQPKPAGADSGSRTSNGRQTISDPGTDPKTIVVRSVDDSRPLFAMPHRFDVTGALFSPDGGRIATISEDKNVRLWNADTGRPLLQLVHPEEVANVVFSADGSRLLTWTLVPGFGHRDVARLWDVETGVLLTRFDNGDVRDAAFGIDGATVITHSDDGWSRTWDATFTVRLRGEELVRVVARERLLGEGRLTDEEVLILQPILGEVVDRDVFARWVG
jgi:WD40 repeat protein